MLLASLNSSVATIALPSLAQAFAAPFQQVQWVILSYLLAITGLIVSVGRLGDMNGRRKLLLAGLALFIVASALCGAAPSLWFLVAARAAQGLGAAVLMALTMAFVGETVPRERTGSAMGMLATMSAVGTALGPSLGGFLIAGLGWRSIFLVNLPLGLLALLLCRRFLPADRAEARADGAAFDLLGTVLLVGTLCAYALAMTVGHGAFGWHNAALLAAALGGIALFAVAEAKVPSPLIRLTAFRDAGFSAALVTNALVMTVMMATLVVGPFYLSRAFGLDEALVGLVVSSGPVISALTGVVAGRSVDRFGTTAMTTSGLTGIAAGSAALALLPATAGIAGYVGAIGLMTLGYQLFQSANNTAVMRDVPPDRRGVVSGMLNLSRNLGQITGASLMGTIFAFASLAPDVASTPGVAATTGLRVTFAVAAALGVLAIAVAAGSRLPILRRHP